MSDYVHRALAIAYIVGWAIYITSLIGTAPSTKSQDWAGAWALISVIAVGVWLGWQARKEQEPKQ